jgi:hypothetical protein
MAISTSTFSITPADGGGLRFRADNAPAHFTRFAFTDATRPVPTEKTFPAGFPIWNTSANQMQYSGGDLGCWFNALGVVT